MRSFRPFLALACCASGLSGCGVYLHDAGLKTSTAEVKASFDSIAAPAFLAEQRQNLLAAGKEEDAAVAGYATALRNEATLTLVRPSGTGSNRTPAARRLLGLVDQDLTTVYGSSSVSADEPQLENAREAIELNRQNLASSTQLVDSARRKFVGLAAKGDKRPTDCAKMLPPPPHEPGAPPFLPVGATPADWAYAWLQDQCLEWRNNNNFLVLGKAAGQIASVRAEIQAANSARDADAADAEALRKEIKEATNGAADAATPPPTAAELAARLDPLIDKIENASALARKAGLEEIAGTLEERVVNELRDASSKLVDDERAVAALTLVRATRDAVQTFQAKPSPDKAAALLIGLAAVRHRLNMAQADVALEEKEMDNLRRQETALIVRASHLARARRIIEKSDIPDIAGFADLHDIKDRRVRAATGEALTAYVAAWNEGEIPYQVLRFRAVQNRRLAALDRAVLAEQDYRAVVKPAIDTLAEYGAGGVTPDSIVTLLGHLGIAGSILAK